MHDAANAIAQSGVIAILRAAGSERLIAGADALLAGGVNVIEVTLTTPGALRVIEGAREHFGERVHFGAGSVLDAETARTAILAGATFIVCPTLNFSTIELCRRYGVCVIPGAYTPTEIVSAWQAGADFVKLFPAIPAGVEYLRAVKQPLPQIKLVAVGGIDAENSAAFISAGATAVGVGGSLVNQQLLDNEDFGAITARAQRLRAAVDAVGMP